MIVSNKCYSIHLCGQTSVLTVFSSDSMFCLQHKLNYQYLSHSCENDVLNIFSHQTNTAGSINNLSNERKTKQNLCSNEVNTRCL